MHKAEVLGVCPRCGRDIVNGKYGPYCVGKCGMSIGWVYGKELNTEQVKSVIAGNRTLVNDLKSKSGKTYSAYVTANGIEPYAYKKKDGSDGMGFRYTFDMEFPDKDDEEQDYDEEQKESDEEEEEYDEEPFR